MNVNIKYPWHNKDNEPLNDIASAIGKLKDATGKYLRNTRSLGVRISKGSSLGATRFNIDWDNIDKSLLINEFIKHYPDHTWRSIFGEQPNFITVKNDFAKLCFAVQTNARRYMVVSKPNVENPNNQKWYQNQKQYISKKTRRCNK